MKKLTLSAMLCAIAVVGSLLSFPMFGSKCAPVQHIVNIVAAVTVGPLYSLVIAFLASLIRNMLGLGSILAFPGSMFGALLCGLVYYKYKNLILTLLAEVFATGILGGISAYYIAIIFLDNSISDMAFYIYVIPFLISTVAGSLLSILVVVPLRKTKILEMR